MRESRGTGKSTAIALKAIAKALERPGQSVLLYDHHGTSSADKILAGTVARIINDLKLHGFKVIKTHPFAVIYDGSVGFVPPPRNGLERAIDVVFGGRKRE